MEIRDLTPDDRSWLRGLLIEHYRRRGWMQVATHSGAIAESRKLKPEIPGTGHDGIPIRDEIEFEWRPGPGGAGRPADRA